MKRWRRPLILIALLLLAGTAVNLAVALGFAAAAEGGPFSAGRVWGATRRSHSFPDGDSITSYRFIQTTEYGWPLRTLGANTGGYSILGNPPSLEGARRRAEEARRRPPPPDYAKGWPAPRILQEAGWFDRSSGRIPTTPMWGGVIANTLFYAVVLATPLSLFPLRRHLRARRGRCPKCGYDLAGLAAPGGPPLRGGDGPAPAAPCPECGATR